jgi:TatA/E family protein of Tat protein translocase
MLAGPDLIVVLAIAFVVIGPKKIPELARTLGKAMGEFKRTTDELKESFTGELKEVNGIRSNLSGMDLFIDLAEKVSASMPDAEATVPRSDSVSGTAEQGASSGPEAGTHAVEPSIPLLELKSEGESSAGPAGEYFGHSKG